MMNIFSTSAILTLDWDSTKAQVSKQKEKVFIRKKPSKRIILSNMKWKWHFVNFIKEHASHLRLILDIRVSLGSYNTEKL